MNLDKRYILMSLMEVYYNEMLSGEKKFEYRSRYPMKETTAFIYISRTKKEIVARIEFGTPIYDGKYYAIPVKKIEKIKPISLEYLRERFNFVVPQSWYYLESKKNLLEFLLNSN